GNSVFHPVDYSIINHRVSQKRLGHAFSTHGLTGNLGWALTPVFMAALMYMADWGTAGAGAGALAAVAVVVTGLGRDLLAGKNQAQTSASESDETSAAAADLAKQSVMQTLATLLVQPALWGAFLFFLFTSMSLSAVQNYTIPMLG